MCHFCANLTHHFFQCDEAHVGDAEATGTASDDSTSGGGDLEGSSNVKLQGVLLGGDQFSCSMARRVIADRINSTNDVQCLKGVIPVVEDWHSKLCLLTVSNYNCNLYL